MEQDQAFLAMIAVLGVASAIYAFAHPYFSGEAKAKKRARAIAVSNRDRSATTRAVDPAKRRKAITESLKEIEGQTKKKRLTIEQRISQAGLRWSKGAFLGACALCAAMFGATLFVVNGSALAVAGGVLVGGFGLPNWVLSFLRNRRTKQFLEEFPGAVDVVVRGIRAGLPVSDCFRVIAAEAPEPVRGEFKLVVESSAVGLSLGEATERFAERLPIPEVSFFSIVVNITQKSGGNLSEALSNLSTVLRERKKMKGKIQAVSTEAKTSAMIIGALPFLVGGAVYILQPGYIMLLFTTVVGKIIVGCCLFWMMIGVFIMRKMINFDF